MRRDYIKISHYFTNISVIFSSHSQCRVIQNKIGKYKILSISHLIWIWTHYEWIFNILEYFQKCCVCTMIPFLKLVDFWLVEFSKGRLKSESKREFKLRASETWFYVLTIYAMKNVYKSNKFDLVRLTSQNTNCLA